MPLAAHRVLSTVLVDATPAASGSPGDKGGVLEAFYPSDENRGPASGYVYHGSAANFFGSRASIAWQNKAGYYREHGALGEKVPSRPSRFILYELGRRVALTLTLTFASPTSLSPLLVAFGLELTAFGVQLTLRPYVLQRDNRLALASRFAVLCTLFFAAMLMTEVDDWRPLARNGNDEMYSSSIEMSKWLLLAVNASTLTALGAACMMDHVVKPALRMFRSARGKERCDARHHATA